MAGEGLRDFGEAARDVIARATVEPGFAPIFWAGADDLDADPVPFPFGGIIGEVHAVGLQRVGEHEGTEIGRALRVRPGAAAFGPVEQGRIGRGKSVPHLFDIIDIKPEALGKAGLGEAGGNTHPQAAGCEFQQGEAARCVEMVHHLGQRIRRGGAADAVEAVDDGGQAERAVVQFGRFIAGAGPEQSNGFGQVADIIPAHLEQDGIGPGADHLADGRCLHRLEVEIAGQRGQRPAPVGIGRFAHIGGDQRQLAVARAGIDEAVEQLGKLPHPSCPVRFEPVENPCAPVLDRLEPNGGGDAIFITLPPHPRGPPVPVRGREIGGSCTSGAGLPRAHG